MIHILLSDDNEAFRQSSKEIGAALGVVVCPFDDWENAQAELDSNFDKYSAVIIDGKGKLRDNSKGEDARHLDEAKGWFREQKAKRRFIPVVVYTGFHPEISSITNTNDHILSVFDKSKTTFEEVINFLKEHIKSLPEQKFQISFPDVHQFAKKYFTLDNQKLVREVFHLMGCTSSDFIWAKNTFDALRRLNEALVDTIPGYYYSAPFTINEYVEKVKRESTIRSNVGNRTLSFIDFFHNNEKPVPDPVYYTVRSIYDTASQRYVHNESDDSDYTPCTDMILGLVYSHFGCYHWFDEILKE